MPLLPPTYPPQNLYTVLGLPTPTRHTTTASTSTPQLTTSQIKAAYRRTLLKHHPDKAAAAALLPPSPSTAPAPRAPPPPPAPQLDIDTITLAREILTDPSARRLYDRHLLLRPADTCLPERPAKYSDGKEETTPAQAETLDLDDMVHDAAAGTWSRGCRCGAGGGFVVREGELEAAAADAAGASAEVVVGCAGCSLFVRVLFGVDSVEGEEEAVGMEDDGRAVGDG